MVLSDEEQAKLREYTARRGQSKGAITRIENFCNELNATHVLEDVNIRLEALEKAYLEFKDYDFQIATFGQPSELELIEPRYFSIKSKLRKAASDLNTVFKDLHQQFQESMLAFANQQRGYLETLSTSFSVPNNDHTEVRLPKLSIPQFGGDYAEFPAFRDSYESSVHSRESLSNVQKFQYLKGLLIGEAATLIRHISITDANYNSTWAKIIERYDKKRCIVSKLLNTFFSIQPVHQRSKLRQGLYNIADEVIRGLEALGNEAERRDPWIIYWMIEKLDKETKLAWAKASSEKDFPTIDEFMKFLGKECDEIEMFTGPASSNTPYSNYKPRNVITNRPTQANVISFETPPCVYCNEQHHLATCPKFKSLDINARRNVVQNNMICYNCLSHNHRVASCYSKFGCKLCRRRHHTLLHDDVNVSYNISKSQVRTNHPLPSPSLKLNNAQVDDEAQESVQETGEDSLTINLATNLRCLSTILPTALVKVRDNAGRFVSCRILLDSGSQASFISEDCIQKLGLPRSNARFTVSGIATETQYTRGMTSVVMKSRFDSGRIFEMNLFILNKLTTIQPATTFNLNNYDYLRNLKLADPNFDKRIEIDIVLGSNKFFEVLENGRLKADEGEPIAQNTAFGWVLAGESCNKDSNIHNLNLVIDENSIDHTLRKFFEVEELDSSNKVQSNEEKEIEDHFSANVTREIDGRYKVALPFKPHCPALGQSEFLAIQRLKSVERRMTRDPLYKQLYSEFMETYRKLDHMERINDDEVNSTTLHCYLPHHAILKTSSTTTKLRTVFDGSAKTSNGLSLNDNLMVGPTIQPPLWSILMRFRTHPIALCADVEKMYRQIRVREEDLEFQRIVWRQSSDLPIEHFRLKTVTYGTSAAPFLAIRSLVQLAQDNQKRFPQVAHIINHDFYVDDLLSGAENTNEARRLKNELKEVLETGGFPLTKWVSNVTDLCDKANTINFDDNGTPIKVLGLAWDPIVDMFQFNVQLNDNVTYTMRTLLSESSKVFDPIGWLSPSIITIKILFQKLWLLKLGWDDALPPNIATQWRELRNNFAHFKQIKIPRHIPWSTDSIQFHGFCDASELAYAAVVYCRVQDEKGDVHVNLLTSKTKVAPLKQVSLPRLELCAAVLLSRLLAKVKKEFPQIKTREFVWIDSTIVLAWLSDQPRRWKTYVANRTSEILATLSRNKWDHVKSTENPADCASRGMSPEALISHDLWWHGPKWLRKPETTNKFNIELSSNQSAVLDEERKKWIQCLHIQPSNDTMEIIFERMSSWRKVRRVLGYCMRFINNSTKKSIHNKTNGPLTVKELQSAERACILWCQKSHYNEEIENLNQLGSKSLKGPLATLAPFIDELRVLRVGGRLQNAECAYDTKHPIILPNSHILSKMIATYYHVKYYHPGPSLLASLLKQKYWMVNGRSMTRGIAHNCIVCVRQRAATSNQLMGSLPTSRVTISRPFSRVGVDFCGPILIATKKGRGAKFTKAYISVFVCMMTKAIHLEVASDLTADAFLAALKRFIARRGLPKEITSDNGTNFVGAAKKLKNFSYTVSKINNTSIISDYLHENGISWKFIPPASPNFGGLWEAAVKSMKAHLIRATGNSNLTFEEMTTLTCQIEAILNSRPLCQTKSDDPSNIDVLTPGHFLIMAPLTSLPEPDLESAPNNRLTRWEQITKRMNSFWRRYSQDYLHTLQQRNKWQNKQGNLELGEIVLVKEDNLPPCEWLKARILEVHPGKDGLIRVVTLRTSKSTLKRPISKIVRLPIN